jgi:TPR repeat protein
MIRQGNDALAEPLLKAAAVRGDDLAALRFAELLIRAFRQQEAEGWFQLAAYANMPGARKAIGTHYKDGTIGRRSADGARTWYQRAMDGGDNTAALGIALVALDKAAASGDYSEAKKLFEAIPEGNDYIEAQWQLGILAMNGLGQEMDANAARKAFEAAAAKGDARSMGMLAELYAGDRLGEPDLAKAREWYIKAAELNDTSAMFRLAALSAEQSPDPAAETEAVRWLERASHLGMAEAKLSLAAAYHHGIGVTKDSTKAFKLLAELRNVGDFAGRLNSAQAHELGLGTEKNLAEAELIYRQMLDESNTPLAILGLARLAEAGFGAQAADPQTAFVYYAQVSETTNDEASVGIIRLKSSTIEGIADEAGALFEMRKALSPEANLPLTLELLARHSCTNPDLKSDCEAALRRMEEMSGYGIDGAMAAFARLLKDGVGIAKDVKRAEALLKDNDVIKRRQFLTSQFILIE